MLQFFSLRRQNPVTFFDTYSSTCLNPGFLLSRFMNGFTAYPGLVVGGLVRVPVFPRACVALARLPGAQVPILAASAAVGIAFFKFTIPLFYWVAGVFARAGYVSMDRQTTQLQRFREKRKNYKRNHDDFSIW
jgi:hypothetical protein